MNEESTLPLIRRNASGSPTSEFGGRGVRHVRVRERDELEAFAHGGLAEPLAALERVDDLVRDARALHPDNLAALRGQMEQLEAEWEALAPEDRASVAHWIESICTPWLHARAPMRGNGLEPAWASDFLLALLSDYDASGQVIESVDRQWRSPSRNSSDVATTSRLAVAAGWMAWSHLIVDPELAESAVTVLGELLDRLDSLAHAGEPFSATDRGWTRAALALEKRLLRHWHPGAGSIH